MRLTADAPELARALGNALAFIPAASNIKHALIYLTPTAVYTVGTDGYAAGTDWTPVLSHQGPKDTVKLLVDKEGLTALERSARMAKKTIAEVVWESPTLSVIVEEGDNASVMTHGMPAAQDALEAVSGMVTEAQKRKETIPGLVMLDPSLLSRFTKVKADKGDRRADFLFGEEGEPVLIKIGPTFKGLIMPIDREVHSNNVGSDGLW